MVIRAATDCFHLPGIELSHHSWCIFQGIVAVYDEMMLFLRTIYGMVGFSLHQSIRSHKTQTFLRPGMGIFGVMPWKITTISCIYLR